LTDRLCEAVFRTIVHNAPKALADPHDYDARANMMWAGMISHNDSVGVGRGASDWASHQMEHELSALYGVAHGAGLSVVIPAWMKYVYKTAPALFAQFGERVFGLSQDGDVEARALAAIDALVAFFRSIGMPVSFAEMGAKAEDIPLLVGKCNLNNGGSKCGFFQPLDREDVANIYRIAAEEV